MADWISTYISRHYITPHSASVKKEIPTYPTCPIGYITGTRHVLFGLSKIAGDKRKTCAIFHSKLKDARSVLL